MIGLRDDRVMWMPTTYHKKADGKWWHSPYFMGMLDT
jgi:hypothetical protein